MAGHGGEDHKPHPAVALCAGALAGVLADGLLHPMDTLRARLQTQVRDHRGDLSLR